MTWDDSSIPQKIYIGIIDTATGIITCTGSPHNNQIYQGFYVSNPTINGVSMPFDNNIGTFPNDYIVTSVSYNDLTIDPITNVVSSSTSDIPAFIQSLTVAALYLILLPITRTYTPYYSSDVTLSTLLQYTLDDYDIGGGEIGPNKVFKLTPPVRGHLYLYENGLDPVQGGEVVSNDLNGVTNIPGFPIIKDLLNNGYFAIYQENNSTTYDLFYIYGNDLSQNSLGKFTTGKDPLDWGHHIYGCSHCATTDELYFPTSELPNFWSELIQKQDPSTGIYKLDLSVFRSNIKNKTTNTTLQGVKQILGTNDIPIQNRNSSVSYILPPAGTWGIDVDNYGTIYATVGDGRILRIPKNYSSYTVLCDGLLEPWGVTIVNKNLPTSHLLIANTRYGTVELLYPDLHREVICGTPIMPYQEGFGKTIYDTSSNYPHGVFGCPTNVTIDTDDYSLLIGDETGLAIRKITSPTLQAQLKIILSPSERKSCENVHLIIWLLVLYIMYRLIKKGVS